MSTSCVVIGGEGGDSAPAFTAVTGSGSSWTATQLPTVSGLPAGVGGTDWEFVGVSCSATACQTAFDYRYYYTNEPSATTWVGVAFTGPGAATSTGWQGKKIPAPAGENTDNGGWYPSAVACAAKGGCVVAGSYSNGTDWVPFIAAGKASSDRFTTVEPTPPSDLVSSPSNGVVAASCATSTDCVVTGRYSNSGGQVGYFLASSGGLDSASDWATTLTTVEPGYVSCVTATSCAASNGSDLYTGAGTTWTSQPQPRTGVYTFSFTQGVSCWKAGHCVVAGYESESNGHTLPVTWLLN